MEEIEKQLAKFVEKSLQVAEKTGEFIIDQAPELLQQFYLWHTMSYIMGILLAIFIYLLGRYAPYFWLKKEPEGRYCVKFFSRYNRQDNISQDPSASWILYGITTTISLIILFINIYHLVYIFSAPKLYLLEYFVK